MPRERLHDIRNHDMYPARCVWRLKPLEKNQPSLPPLERFHEKVHLFCPTSILDRQVTSTTTSASSSPEEYLTTEKSTKTVSIAPHLNRIPIILIFRSLANFIVDKRLSSLSACHGFHPLITAIETGIDLALSKAAKLSVKWAGMHPLQPHAEYVLSPNLYPTRIPWNLSNHKISSPLTQINLPCWMK